MRRRTNTNPDLKITAPLLAGRITMISLIQTLAVAEYLSFQRAAQALGTSQSSVSARIRALEEELGVDIFDRSTRGVRLTEAGRRFVEQVESAVNILDRAIKTAAMEARGEEGELRIGVHALAPGCFLDRLLHRFRNDHPGVQLNVTEGTARDAQFMVRDGRLDLAFMACTHEIPDLNSRVIWRDRLMVALPAKHPLTDTTAIEWRRLAEETFLVRCSGTGPQVHDLIVLRSAGRWPTPTIRRVDVGRIALMSMIAASQGISICVEEATEANSANVTFRPITDETEPIPFSAIWSPHSRNPSLRYLLNLAKQVQSNP